MEKKNAYLMQVLYNKLLRFSIDLFNAQALLYSFRKVFFTPLVTLSFIAFGIALQHMLLLTFNLRNGKLRFLLQYIKNNYPTVQYTQTHTLPLILTTPQYTGAKY